jgi:hypothetical protein
VGAASRHHEEVAQKVRQKGCEAHGREEEALTVILASAHEGCMLSDTLAHDPEFHIVHETVKVFRLDLEGSPALFGGAGSQSGIAAALSWLREGMSEERPDIDPENYDFDALVLTAKGLWMIHAALELLPVTTDVLAVGSGAGPALGAVHAGASLEEAVCIAMRVDLQCGGEVVCEKL